MRRFLFSFLIITISLSACNDSKQKETTTTKNEKNNNQNIDTSDVKNQNLGDSQEQLEVLQKSQPLSLDELKALIPETLNGISRSDVTAQNALGTGMSFGDYAINDSAKLKLVIYDCSGTAGASLYNRIFVSNAGKNSDNGDTEITTIDFLGRKVVVEYHKDDNDYILTYLANDHLLIMIDGQYTGLKAVKQAASSLDFK